MRIEARRSRTRRRALFARLGDHERSAAEADLATGERERYRLVAAQHPEWSAELPDHL